MKRVFYSLLTLIMAAAIILPAATPVMADSDKTQESELKPAPALMIQAPKVTDVSRPVTITISSKHDRGLIAGASVYALNTDDLVITADKTNYTTLLSDFAETAESKGLFIGTTGNDGTVTGQISESARFMLVAIKEGYLPGFARITVTLAAKTALNIKSPGAANVDTEVTFTVTERYSSTKVEGAAVYARLITDSDTKNTISAAPLIKKVQAVAQTVKQASPSAGIQASTVIQSNAAKLKASVNASQTVMIQRHQWNSENATVIRAYPWDEIEAANYAAEIQSEGFLLGYTGVDGTVTYTFTSAGRYMLTAIEDGYIPGFARIYIKNQIDDTVEEAVKERLGVKAPSPAPAGQEVTIKAFYKSSSLPAEDATVYAFKARVAASLKATPSTSAAENGTAIQILTKAAADGEISEKEASALLLQSAVRPITIGVTDDNGEVQYTFSKPGVYVLIAFKDGCLPGGDRIKVVSIQAVEDLAIKAAMDSASGLSASIKVWEKASSQPVSGAAVYVLKVNNLPIVKPMPATTGSSKSQGEQNRLTVTNSGTSNRLTVHNGWIQNEADTTRGKGTLAGYTDDNGQLLYTFSSSGQYILAAFKDGSNPGFVYFTVPLPTFSTTSDTK
ncbi:MAG: hypothetical protein JXA01_04005 [Dehalococcoidia bacterium]|nr:hypothetical protein [Dehalococcoidia bacterium]